MKYPIGIQDFKKIIENEFVYVDKTDLVYELVQENVCFLSRPRRFGKSLLVSTLDAYFKGERNLFCGLSIEKFENDWESYPVFRMDFSDGNYDKKDELSNKLNSYLEEWESIYGKIGSWKELGSRFSAVIKSACEKTGKRVVVLIDEYDKPLLDVFGTEIEEINRNILKGFYGAFKVADASLRFVFLTGVTKFSQVSVFSGFNQVRDISMDKKYDSICGITEGELYDIFDKPIREMADENRVSYDEMKHILKKRYDGYHFSHMMKDIYNPFSLINAFSEGVVKDYWYQSGTPSYLAKLLEGYNVNIQKMLSQTYDSSYFMNYRGDIENPLAMLYQSGYITIKEYDRKYGDYRLDFPNDEVRKGFVNLIAGCLKREM